MAVLAIGGCPGFADSHSRQPARTADCLNARRRDEPDYPLNRHRRRAAGTGFRLRLPRLPPRPRDEAHRRRPCSAVVKFNNAVTLLDAGLPDLMTQWPAGSFQQFLLTHYHMDHVQGLFPLRWGVGEPIPVYGPPDEQGCDDLFKHPGLLDFSHTVEPFVRFELQGLRVTPLPLNHSSSRLAICWSRPTAGSPGYRIPPRCRRKR
jgi:hypothetical protein